MKDANKYTQCDYQCPLHQSCQRYNPTMVKTKTFHYAGRSPYNYRGNFCEEYITFEKDESIQKTLSNGH